MWRAGEVPWTAPHPDTRAGALPRAATRPATPLGQARRDDRESLTDGSC